MPFLYVYLCYAILPCTICLTYMHAHFSFLHALPSIPCLPLLPTWRLPSSTFTWISCTLLYLYYTHFYSICCHCHCTYILHSFTAWLPLPSFSHITCLLSRTFSRPFHTRRPIGAHNHLSRLHLPEAPAPVTGSPLWHSIPTHCGDGGRRHATFTPGHVVAARRINAVHAWIWTPRSHLLAWKWLIDLMSRPLDMGMPPIRHAIPSWTACHSSAFSCLPVLHPAHIAYHCTHHTAHACTPLLHTAAPTHTCTHTPHTHAHCTHCTPPSHCLTK